MYFDNQAQIPVMTCWCNFFFQKKKLQSCYSNATISHKIKHYILILPSDWKAGSQKSVKFFLDKFVGATMIKKTNCKQSQFEFLFSELISYWYQLWYLILTRSNLWGTEDIWRVMMAKHSCGLKKRKSSYTYMYILALSHCMLYTPWWQQMSDTGPFMTP